MPVLPGLQAIVDAVASAPKPDQSLSVAEQREQGHAIIESTVNALSGEPQSIASQTDYQVPVEGGEITVRRYCPEGAGPFPALVYYHGGGFWIGTLDHSDGRCRALANEAQCVVVSVAYRLAPEAKFPVPVEDSFAALRWVVDHAETLNIDRDRVAVGGASAGGNLAAVVALLARDRRGPKVILQILEVPATDLTMSQPSIEENANGPMLTKASCERCRELYLEDLSDARNPLASPLLAEDLSGLPPAIVMTMEFDPLRDEGEAYALRMQDAGVQVEYTMWKGQFHGSQNMKKLIPEESSAYQEMIVEGLRNAFA